jgi:hypothetical protein
MQPQQARRYSSSVVGARPHARRPSAARTPPSRPRPRTGRSSRLGTSLPRSG